MSFSIGKIFVAGGLACFAAATPATTLELAPDDMGGRSIERFLGTPVLGSGGEQLGVIRDFLADERTSELAFVVVSSGGMFGLGDVMRLVPMEMLTPGLDGSHFTMEASQPRWRQMLRLNEDDFEDGRVAFTGQDAPAGSTAGSRPAALDRPLIRLGKLPGKNVTAGDREVGEIEDIALDFTAGTGRALFDPDPDFAGTTNKVLAPLGEFIFAQRGHRIIGTRLTKADFNDLVASWNQTSGPRQPPAVAERHRELRYGADALEENNAARSDIMVADARVVTRAADSVRDALGDDPKTRGAAMQVIPENGRVILRGAARDPAQKKAIEDLAKRAAGKVTVQSEIRMMTR